MRPTNPAPFVVQNGRGFTLLELLIALAILVVLVTFLTVLWSDKTAEPRPATTIAEELVGAIAAVVSWKDAFLGATPSIDDSRCAEAKRLVDRLRALLDEYAANPQRDQAVLGKRTQELDALMPTLRRWCPSQFP